MKKSLTYILTIIFILGCSGGETPTQDDMNALDSEVNDYVTEGYIITSEKVVDLNLTKRENVIAGSPCTNTSIYNDKLDSFDNNKKFTRGILKKGEYKVLFTEFYSKYNNSDSILFALSLNISLEDMKVDKDIELEGRKLKLYKLLLEKNTFFMITQKSLTATIFDNNLTAISTSDPLDRGTGTEQEIIYLGEDTFELKKGTYYIEIEGFYCNKSGTLKFITL